MTETPKSGDPLGTPEDHAASHMDAHAVLSDDDHGHAEAQLGPVDWMTWGAGLLGVVAGLIVVGFFVAAIS